MANSDTGAALGIDVGFSERSRSTAFCLLLWDRDSICLRTRRTKTDAAARRRTLADLVSPDLPALAVALDGPLTHGFALIQHYRAAEALLSQGVFQRRGKPGQTSSPTGLRLHEHATALAQLVLEAEAAGQCRLLPAGHAEPVHESAIVEAFPNQFLASLLPEAALPQLRRNASDLHWQACVNLGRFPVLLDCLLPGRALQTPLSTYVGHDDRAAIVCALTALSVVAGDGVGVGDAVDGDIMLPPPGCWGAAMDAADPWMERALRFSLTTLRERHPRWRAARITHRGRKWIS